MSSRGGSEAGPSTPAEAMDVDLGLSAIFVCAAGSKAEYVYFSESIEDILGWTPKEMCGKSPYDFIHPDEIPHVEAAHYQATMRQKTAFIMYFRVRHKQGYYVTICLSSSFANDKSIGLLSRASDGPARIEQARTAREVIEITRLSDNELSLRHWSGPGLPASSRATPPLSHESQKAWPASQTQPRTAFHLDRFTATSRIVFVTNDAIISSFNLVNQPFYSVIKPSDRELVRSHIEAAKGWTPVQYKEGKMGGHGYARFSVLKIPDLPPAGSRMPEGTDESERMMPGQGFIPVEGIFTAGSDGVICVIERLP